MRKPPTVPSPRAETIRKRMIALLRGSALSARELSVQVGIPERDVPSHLEHLRHSLHGTDERLLVVPAACRRCGFVFAKRERFERPGRCPACRGGSISEPRFVVE